MKKIGIQTPGGDCFAALKKGLLAMKITLLLILIPSFTLLATGTYSQTARVSLKLNQTSIKQVLTEIEHASEFYFLYNNELIDVERKVDIVADNEQISTILDRLFANKEATYTVYDRQIVISPANMPIPQNVQRKVSGKVTDASGGSLPGVSVVVKGTTLGVISDADGKYTLSNIPENAVLQFSFVGMKAQEVAILSKTTINVTLAEETVGIEEVVAIGYGTQKKINLTGSISAVSSEEISKRQVGQSSMVLQGIAPGVTVTQSSGQPGRDGGNIRIRGIGTLNDSNPLILVDGIEMAMNNVDPNLIESISVLKDAASSAIYGSRAANGVILITTKRAKAGQFTLDYNTYFGIQSPTDLTNPVNAVDHMKYMDIANTNVGRSPVFGDAIINDYTTKGSTNRDLYPDTDWHKEVDSGSGLQQSHFVTLSAGTEKIRVLAALGYFDQEGIIQNTGYKRYTARFNSDMQITSKLNAKFDIFARFIDTKEPSSGISGDNSGVLYWMNRMPANQVSRLSSGKWGTGWEGENPTAKMLDGGLW